MSICTRALSTCLLSILLFSGVFSQQIDSAAIVALADSAIRSYTWDVQTFEKGSIMFLDVPYLIEGRTDFLTLSVAKSRKTDRPEFMSVIIPNSIDKQQVFFLIFAKTVMKEGQWSIEPDKRTMIRLDFDYCDSTTCRTRMFKGFAKGEIKTDSVDVFSRFFEYDHASFMIFEHGQHQTIMVPLFSFKEQYKKLE
jgi:hypothetical protein